MLNNLNKELKKEINNDQNLPENSGRNNSDYSPLLEAEAKIKSIKKDNVPAFNDFQEELKQKILKERQSKTMKNPFEFVFSVFRANLMVPAAVFVIVLFGVLGGMYFLPKDAPQIVKDTGEKDITTTPKDEQSEETPRGTGKKMFAFRLVQPAFADFQEMREIATPVLKGDKAAWDELINLSKFEEDKPFSAEQRKAIEEFGFFLAENNITGSQEWGTDDFVNLYDKFDGSDNKYFREADEAVFISSDLALHLYHILVDRSFQKMEEDKFHPQLTEMTKALLEDSLEKYESEEDELIKESYKRVSAYYLVPYVILEKASIEEEVELDPSDFDHYGEYLDALDQAQKDNSQGKLDVSLNSKNFKGLDIDEEIFELAKAELDLINKATGAGPSPLFTPYREGFVNDYSQFKPRSHYTKNNTLKSYFMAMMWYGRMGFTLNSPELTRDALIITGQVNTVSSESGNISDQWAAMMTVIDFFVGEVDDLTPFQYTEAMKDVYGDEMTDTELLSDNKLNEFIKYSVDNLPSPKILSELLIIDPTRTKEDVLKDTLQFRFMGQRFTPDAYVLNSLTQGAEAPDKETGQKLPSMPTALMPMSIINPDNKVIKNYLDEWVSEKAPNSDKVIAKFYKKLKEEFAKYDNNTWTKNMYWNWLDSFRILTREYDEGYPFFMRSEAWQKKTLSTILGSYTELKHDTLLYAKQSYAEMGGGGPQEGNLPPVPKGYVEPNVEFWNKMIDLAELTEKGLRDREVFPEEFDYKYESFIQSATFFRDIAEKELKDEKISDEEFEKLRRISDDLYDVVEAFPGEELSVKERRAGIIADIHTDGIAKEVLYEATGKPNIIYVAVRDINGTRLTIGATFNHYEFTEDSNERLSDENWQERVYEKEGDLPQEDKWVKEIKK